MNVSVHPWPRLAGRTAAAPSPSRAAVGWRAFVLAVLMAALVVLVAYQLAGGSAAVGDGRVPSPSPQATARPVTR